MVKSPVPIRFGFDCVLPTGILPNAMMREAAIIEFIGAYNKNTSGVVLKPPLFDTIFQEHGTWPNSIDTCFHYVPVWSKYIIPEEAAIGTLKNKKYIYPIVMTPHFSNFVGVGPLPEKLIGSYFWKNISTKAMNDIRNRKAIILLCYYMEPFITKDLMDALHESLTYSRIPKKHIYLCINSFDAKEVYESWYEEKDRLVQVFNTPHCYEHASWFYRNHGKTRIMSEDDFDRSLTSNIERKHKFLVKTRSPRLHRQALVIKLHDNDLLKYANWSYLSGDPITEANANYLRNAFSLGEGAISSVRQLNSLIPKTLDGEDGATNSMVNAWTDPNFGAYSTSYFEVCSETYVEFETKSLTEKIFKPIANFHPFLFFAFPGAMQLLRDLGFKTFDGFIDESYDLEKDHGTRLEMICKEASRLCLMSNQDLHSWYVSMSDILLHNHRHLLNHYRGYIKTEELIQALHEFTRD